MTSSLLLIKQSIQIVIIGLRGHGVILPGHSFSFNIILAVVLVSVWLRYQFGGIQGRWFNHVIDVRQNPSRLSNSVRGETYAASHLTTQVTGTFNPPPLMYLPRGSAYGVPDTML